MIPARFKMKFDLNGLARLLARLRLAIFLKGRVVKT